MRARTHTTYARTVLKYVHLLTGRQRIFFDAFTPPPPPTPHTHTHTDIERFRHQVSVLCNERVYADATLLD